MAEISAICDAFSVPHNDPLGRIVLNGYAFTSDDLTGRRHRLHSFRVLEGDFDVFNDYWEAQRPFLLQIPEEASIQVRIAAMPSDVEGFGLLEFL